MRDPFEVLLAALLPISGLPFIEVRQNTLGGIHRVELRRELGPGFGRYAELKHFEPDGDDTHMFEVYSTLFGTYGRSTEGSMDSRRWGDLEYMVAITHSFLVDIAKQDEIPKFEVPDGFFGNKASS